MKTILLTGKTGQVGWELQRTLAPLGNVVAVDRSTMDLSQPDSMIKTIRAIRPNVLINAAAYTAVDKAEDEEELAMAINGTAPGILAEEVKRLGGVFIHYSTDYIFDGLKATPYIEEDRPAPVNVYGKTKLVGEEAVQAVGGSYLIFRTSWVYSARGKNFLRTILRLAKEREELEIVDDQIGAPTWARLIASITSHCLAQSMNTKLNHVFASGIYHLALAGQTSWYGFAQAIIGKARRYMNESLTVQNVKPIRTDDFPTFARRPMNSCLATGRLQDDFNLTMPDWNMGLELCLESM